MTIEELWKYIRNNSHKIEPLIEFENTEDEERCRIWLNELYEIGLYYDMEGNRIFYARNVDTDKNLTNGDEIFKKL